MFAYLDLVPAGRFLTKPHFIGSTDDEVRTMFNTRKIEAERRQQLMAALLVACSALMQTEPQGRC